MRTRFAPSPTGPLHLGHAYSALVANDMATSCHGEFLLRIEDIDQSRARQHWEDQIYDDLEWLGLTWPRPVMRQSDRLPAYRAALNDLGQRGLIYPCSCSRRDIEQAASAPQEGAEPLFGPDGLVYPGTCRPKSPVLHDLSETPPDAALRLNMDAVLNELGTGNPAEMEFTFLETGAGPDGETGTITFTGADVLKTIGDIVLARRNMGTSYHLSVVIDDANQAITHVVRGCDLFEATKIHVVLQCVLGLPIPIYHHHALIRDDQGKRLAKRDDARAIAQYRAQGLTPDGIRKLVGLD